MFMHVAMMDKMSIPGSPVTCPVVDIDSSLLVPLICS